MIPDCNDNSVARRAFSLLSLALGAVLLLTGCAGNKMALEVNKKQLTQLAKPIGIFTLRTENQFHPSYQPFVAQIRVESADGKKTAFWTARPYREGKNKFYEYLVSVDLPAGRHAVKEVRGGGSGFLISGHFEFPMNLNFALNDGITYLGHVSMVNRERKEGEPRSGGIFPLIDQATCGFSGGTFDVSISDRSEADLADFILAYPALKDVQIQKALLTK